MRVSLWLWQKKTRYITPSICSHNAYQHVYLLVLSKEIKIILRLFLVIVIYCQGSSSQIKSITSPCFHCRDGFAVLYLKLFKNQNFGKVPQSSSSLRSLSLVYFHGYDYRSFFVVPCHPAAKWTLPTIFLWCGSESNWK